MIYKKKLYGSLKFLGLCTFIQGDSHFHRFPQFYFHVLMQWFISSATPGWGAEIRFSSVNLHNLQPFFPFYPPPFPRLPFKFYSYFLAAVGADRTFQRMCTADDRSSYHHRFLAVHVRPVMHYSPFSVPLALRCYTGQSYSRLVGACEAEFCWRQCIFGIATVTRYFRHCLANPNDEELTEYTVLQAINHQGLTLDPPTSQFWNLKWKDLLTQESHTLGFSKSQSAASLSLQDNHDTIYGANNYLPCACWLAAVSMGWDAKTLLQLIRNAKQCYTESASGQSKSGGFKCH